VVPPGLRDVQVNMSRLLRSSARWSHAAHSETPNALVILRMTSPTPIDPACAAVLLGIRIFTGLL